MYSDVNNDLSADAKHESLVAGIYARHHRRGGGEYTVQLMAVP
jgi:hypothetical protein